jgi:hypothetical protein
MLKTYEDTLP